MSRPACPLALTLYRALMWSYPKAFRDRHGHEMVRLFTEQVRERPRTAGTPMGNARHEDEAEAGNIVRLVVTEGLMLAGAGIVLGLLVAVPVTGVEE